MMKYASVKEIGRGAVGIVEEVRRIDETGEPLARKRMHQWAADDQEYLRRFKREVRILQAMQHPGIIEIVDADLDAALPWFVMPLAKTSLQREIVPTVGLSDEHIQVLFDQVLDALHYAHSQGVVHRDLKPHNILIVEGRAVIADFGLGRRFDSDSTTLTVTGDQGGTFGYVAPEQWTGLHAVDESADIYALGSLLFQMVTGLNPVGISRQTMPLKYNYIINRCRSQQPTDRYASVDELREDFGQLWLPEPDLTPNVERATALLDDAVSDQQSHKDVIALYFRNPQDKELYRVTVPNWSNEFLRMMAEEEPEALVTIIGNFDGHIEGNLDFSYVDIVADFLERVYEVSRDPELRRIALTRVLVMGAFHFRWHAGGVFAKMAKTASGADALDVRRVLYNNPNAAGWVADWVRAEGASPHVIEAIDELDPEG
jgi:eukaryotic-like serine/threonine-protein kinase